MKRLLNVLLMSFLATTYNYTPVFSQTDLSDTTLVLYYDFDKMDMESGIVYDNSSNNLEGKIYNAYEAVGYKGRCLDYVEEDSSRVNVGNSPVLDMSFITVSAWVNPVSYGTDDKRIEILEKEMSYWLNIRNNNDGKDKDHNNVSYNSKGHLRVGFFAYSDSTDQAERKAFHLVDNDKRIWKRVDSDSKVELNKWTHVAMVYNGDSLFAYLDGKVSNGIKIDSLKKSQTEIMKTKWNFVVGQKHAQKTFGDSTNIYNAPFDGKIDQLIVFNKGKSHDEIYSIYKNTLTHINNKLEAGITQPLMLFPNPAAQYIHLSNTQIENEKLILVYDVQGKEILRNRMNSLNNSLYIGHLKQGAYIVKSYHENGAFHGAEKFLKN